MTITEFFFSVVEVADSLADNVSFCILKTERIEQDPLKEVSTGKNDSHHPRVSNRIRSNELPEFGATQEAEWYEEIILINY